MSHEASTNGDKISEMSKYKQNDDADILVMIACARGCAVRQGIRRKKRHIGLLKKRK